MAINIDNRKGTTIALAALMPAKTTIREAIVNNTLRLELLFISIIHKSTVCACGKINRNT
mgnify:CR=1 FL=1